MVPPFQLLIIEPAERACRESAPIFTAIVRNKTLPATAITLTPDILCSFPSLGALILVPKKQHKPNHVPEDRGARPMLQGAQDFVVQVGARLDAPHGSWYKPIAVKIGTFVAKWPYLIPGLAAIAALAILVTWIGRGPDG